MKRLAATTWPEAAELARAGAVLLVPVGSTEQHGPHLPLTTDTDLAEAVAVGAAARCGQVAVAPALAYGSSGEHQGFAGTLSIGREATELALVELARSALLTFELVVFVSTHGGNAVPVSRAVEQFAGNDAGIHHVMYWTPRWGAGRAAGAGAGRPAASPDRGPGAGAGSDLHAGRTETSLMLAVAPDRVRLDALEGGTVEPAETLLPLLRRVGVRPVSDNGVLGDPTGATAAEGRRLLSAAIDDLLEVIERCGAARRSVAVDRDRADTEVR